MAQKTVSNGVILATLLVAGLVVSPGLAHAATLFVSPASGAHDVGTTFSVAVQVSTPNQAINAISASLTFPPDALEVTSLSKEGSIVSLWVAEPSFSNTRGTVQFEGIMLNPGFTGSNGQVLTIGFRTKAAASSARIAFASGSILANDGQGTNVLEGLSGATMSIGTINGAPEPPPPPTDDATEPPQQAPNTPAAPVLRSPTHPDPNAWYGRTDVRFTWDVPPDVTGVRLLVGEDPNAVPTVTHAPPIRERSLTDLNLEDGVWYFSARFRNAAGWGPVARSRFQIDTEPPDRFEITEAPREDITESQVAFIFDANDATSGISHYEVHIDGGPSQAWRDDGSHRFVTPELEPGEHTLTAWAVDRAGNALERTVAFTIVPPEGVVVIVRHAWKMQVVLVIILIVALIVLHEYGRALFTKLCESVRTWLQDR